MAILLVLTIPLQKNFLDISKQQTSCSQLLRAINLTRSEAVSRGHSVTLCSSADHKTCSGQWGDGYIVFSDKKIIHIFQNISLAGTLNWRAFPLNQRSIEFLPSGLPKAENGTFWYCLPSAKNPAWAIVMNYSGRARVVLPNHAGAVIDEKGKTLAC